MQQGFISHFEVGCSAHDDVNDKYGVEAAFSVLLLPSLATFYFAASAVAEASPISSSSAPLFTPFTCNKKTESDNVVQNLSEVSFSNCENLCNKSIRAHTWGTVSVPFTSVAFGGFTMGIT